jgi:hypothetical protein
MHYARPHRHGVIVSLEQSESTTGAWHAVAVPLAVTSKSNTGTPRN